MASTETPGKIVKVMDVTIHLYLGYHRGKAYATDLHESGRKGGIQSQIREEVQVDRLRRDQVRENFGKLKVVDTKLLING